MEKLAKRPTLLSILFGNNEGIEIEDTESTYVESDYISKLKRETEASVKSENKKTSKNGGFSEGLAKFEPTLEKMKEQRGEEPKAKGNSSKEIEL